MTLKFLALQGAPYIYDISTLRVKDAVIFISFHKNPKVYVIWNA
jgi:hypothetical protein